MSSNLFFLGPILRLSFYLDLLLADCFFPSDFLTKFYKFFSSFLSLRSVLFVLLYFIALVIADESQIMKRCKLAIENNELKFSPSPFNLMREKNPLSEIVGFLG